MPQNWERCEAGLADSMLQLKDVKTRLNQSMPESDDELENAQKFNKVGACATSTHTHTQHMSSSVALSSKTIRGATVEGAVISLAELNLSGGSQRQIFLDCFRYLFSDNLYRWN